MTLSWNPSPHNVTPFSPLQEMKEMSAVILLNEQLIPSCWMIVNTYFLMKNGAKQCRHVPTFCWQTKHHMANCLSPKRHNGVILKKIVWRHPLEILQINTQFIANTAL